MPENTVKVDRTTPWGNPFRWQDYEIKRRDVPHDVDPRLFAIELSVAAFRDDLEASNLPVKPADVRSTLRGKNLACWCPPGQPCHADVLLEMANAESSCPADNTHHPKIDG